MATGSPAQSAANAREKREAESPWRRDEVVHLLHAWRHVAVAVEGVAALPPLAAGAFPAAAGDHKARLNAGMFAKFQEFYQGDTQRTMKSLVKTRKSLERSFRFIAMFNQNHIIAKSMSAAFGGHNWFAVPQDEQRRIVNAHYKRKPFAYIDQEIFDAIELILEGGRPSVDRPTDVQQGHRDVESAEMNRDSDPMEEVPPRKAKTPKANAAASAQKLSSTWTRDDVLLLLQAWMEVLNRPRIEDEQILEIDKQINARYLELAGGDKARSAMAMRIKRYSLIQSYQFISDFNANKIAPAANGSGNDWYALSRKERNQILQEHYKKSHYAHLDEDMLPAVKRIMQKSKKLETRKPSVSSSSGSSASTLPWTHDEDMSLVLAWRAAVATSRAATESEGVSDSRIYQKFVEFSEGKTMRTAKELTKRKEVLVNTYEFISAFKRERSGSSNEFDGQIRWFSTPKSERKSLIANAKPPCTEITEGTYIELDRIIRKKMEPATNTRAAEAAAPPQLYHSRAVTVWNREEVQHLLRAWNETLDGPPMQSESVVAFNSRVYNRFLELCEGRTSRSVKAMQAKRESIINSYQFISDFNQNKLVLTGAMRAWGTNDWFSISHEEQKNLVKAHYKKVSFSYLYSDMLPAVEKIIQKTPTVEKDSQLKNQKLETRAPGIVYPKPRPNSWTPEELRHFLRAWREAVSDSPRQPDESVTSFNARIYKRFQVLCGGRSKKAEVSLLTKRKTLTTTFEFISEYNRKHGSDRAEGGPKAAWFSLSDLDRKKKISTVNKSSHSCSNIDEETFDALAVILGVKGDDEESDENPSTAERERTRSRSDISASTDTNARERVPSPASTRTKSDNADEISLLHIPESSQAKRTSELVTPTQIPLGQQTPSEVESDAETVSDNSFAPSPLSSPERARKKHKSEPDVSAVAGFFAKQTQHLTSLFIQIREERQREQEQRRSILEQIKRDQEERRKDREERKLEREQTKREWEQFRRDRQVEREKDRALLQQILSRKRNDTGSKIQNSQVDDDDRGSCAELLMLLHS